MNSSSQIAKQELGRRLRALMNARNMSQSDLARASGIQRSNISSYVRGLTYPTPLFLKKLAEALGVAPEELSPEAAVSHGPAEDRSPLVTRLSQDTRRMHISADIWLPTEVGMQITQLLGEHLPFPQQED